MVSYNSELVGSAATGDVSDPVLEEWIRYSTPALACFYVLSALGLFVPSWVRRHRWLAELQEKVGAAQADSERARVANVDAERQRLLAKAYGDEEAPISEEEQADLAEIEAAKRTGHGLIFPTRSASGSIASYSHRAVNGGAGTLM